MNTQLNSTQNANTEIDAFETETGWTYADAVDMAAECRREDRLFGKPNQGRRVRRPSTPASRAAAFLKRTGWTLQDAMEMTIECRREDRLFGGAAPLYL